MAKNCRFVVRKLLLCVALPVSTLALGCGDHKPSTHDAGTGGDNVAGTGGATGAGGGSDAGPADRPADVAPGSGGAPVVTDAGPDAPVDATTDGMGVPPYTCTSNGLDGVTLA